MSKTPSSLRNPSSCSLSQTHHRNTPPPPPQSSNDATSLSSATTGTHMWYIHPSSNVEPPTNGSSQNPQIYSQPSTPTNSNTCYKHFLSNITLPNNEIESPIRVDNIQLNEGDQNSGGKKSK